MATALSQSPLLLSARQARQPSCRSQTAHSGSCPLDTLLTPPPLPGPPQPLTLSGSTISPSRPQLWHCFLGGGSGHFQVPCILGSVPLIASDGPIWDVWCTLVSSHLNDTRAGGRSCYTHHGASCWAQHQQVLNKCVHPSCMQFSGDEHQEKPDEVLGKLEMTVCGYWPSSCTQMKTISSN